MFFSSTWLWSGGGRAATRAMLVRMMAAENFMVDFRWNLCQQCTWVSNVGNIGWVLTCDKESESRFSEWWTEYQTSLWCSRLFEWLLNDGGGKPPLSLYQSRLPLITSLYPRFAPISLFTRLPKTTLRMFFHVWYRWEAALFQDASLRVSIELRTGVYYDLGEDPVMILP